ncbi:DNA glycosylase [Gilbertella persicaria]|uniref:DNA glycosylase n=1 Tax=Gilbertella persicaria TaxID=101096 RepID=UPI002220B491|nr:DNA glycosylase [Gilbertella persicaria]KAI8090168.1 DNA glycosylase [Gilbertella persicaria]
MSLRRSARNISNSNGSAKKESAVKKIKTETATKKRKAPEVKVEDNKPQNWDIVYEMLEAFREKEKAPVDTMGCERLADTTASPVVQRFQTLIALMLSSQTKDTVTSVAVAKLQKELPGGLCLQSILNVDEAALDKMIAAVGFHTKKASYIKRTAEILRDQYAGDIPDTIEGLVDLPGVGPKMGYLTLQVAWDKNIGIGVDVHVHRICNRLGWVKTKTPEETRTNLQSWLPKDRWKKLNPIMVGYGQIVCLPRGPRCDICPISQYCPSSEIKKIVKKKQKIEKTESVYFKTEPTEEQRPLDW